MKCFKIIENIEKTVESIYISLECNNELCGPFNEDIYFGLASP